MRDFLLWWLAQMRDLLPDSWRSSGPLEADALLVETEPGAATVTLTRRRAGTLTPMGAFRLDADGRAALAGAASAAGRALAVILRLPPGPLLEKRLVLPAATARSLDSVIPYEMDRETPFAAEDVWWNATVLGRDAAQGRLDVGLTLVPRETVRPVLAFLAEAGLHPHGIEAAGAGGRISWLPLETRSPRASRWQPTAPRIALIGLALAVLAIAAPFLRQALALADLQSQIDALAPQVKQVEALRRQLAGGGQGGDVLAAERARLGDALKSLAVLTDALPDDTYLSDLTLRERQLALTGRSADAARLIGLLAAAPDLKDPSFSAPVTRAKDSATDLFSIRTEAKP